jgi:hypothetical protein
VERLRQHHEKERRDLDELKHAASAGISVRFSLQNEKEEGNHAGALLPVVD